MRRLLALLGLAEVMREFANLFHALKRHRRPFGGCAKITFRAKLGAPSVRRSENRTVPRTEPSGEVIVRETVCRTVLNRTAIGDYSLNCYTGCVHACVYCYARYMQRFHPHPEPWGRFVDVKVNAPEALKKQLRRAPPGEVFMSSACDGWQPLEREWRLTRRCCELLIERGFKINVLTKSALVLSDIDIFAGRSARIGVTITTLDERLRALWEPGASSVEERLGVIQAAQRARLETAVMFGPLLPYLSDGEESVAALFEQAARLDIDHIWVDALNPRPKVWESVVELLRREFPRLEQPYRLMLFNPDAREEYLASLRDRVRRIAQRYSLEDRVDVCL